MIPDLSDCNMIQENAAGRSERRRHAGIRSALIWGGVLLLALLFYLAACGIAGHFQSLRWSRAINAAVRQGDAETLAALLQSCRKAMPEMVRRVEFAIWQQHLLTLRERQMHRKEVFKQKLAALKTLADSDAPGKVTLELELAEAARYASNEEELADLRQLQLYCESLNRTRELATAQSGVEALKKTARWLEEIDSMLQAGKWQQAGERLEFCRQQLALIRRGFQKFPAVADAAEQQEKKLSILLDKARTVQEESLQAEKAFAELPVGDLKEFQSAARKLLEQYKNTPRAAEVQKLLADANILQRPYKAAATARVERMQKLAAAARQSLTQALTAVAKLNLNGLTSELIVQDQTGKIHFFETYEKPLLQKNQQTGAEEMIFNDLSKRRIKVRFLPDRVEVALPDIGVISGKLVRQLQNGTLPDTTWQQMLFSFQRELELLNDAASGRFIQDKINAVQLDKHLNPAIKKALSQAFNTAAEILTVPPEQFDFELSVWKTIAANTPVFYGINPSLLPENSSCWRIDSRQENPFVLLHSTPRKMENTLLAVPENRVDYTWLMQKWQLEAQEKNLKLPKDLPEFVTAG